MSTFVTFGLLLVLAAPSPSGSEAGDIPQSASAQTPADSHSRFDAHRPFHEISQELRGLLRQEARSEDPDHWHRVVLQLVQLYGELTHDQRLSSSDTLTSYRLKLRSRLLKIQRKLERTCSVTEKTTAGKSGENAGVQAPSVGSGRAVRLSHMPPAAPADSLSHFSASAAAAWPGAAGGAARGDYGDTLVELIRATISPDFWDVNGGPGTIVYYRQWQVLVVRATSEVHERIGGAVGGLRK